MVNSVIGPTVCSGWSPATAGRGDLAAPAEPQAAFLPQRVQHAGGQSAGGCLALLDGGDAVGDDDETRHACIGFLADEADHARSWPCSPLDLELTRKSAAPPLGTWRARKESRPPSHARRLPPRHPPGSGFKRISHEGQSFRCCSSVNASARMLQS